MEWIDARMTFLMLHLFGVALGAGAAFTGDWLFLRSIRDRRLSKDEMRLMDTAGVVVWVGLVLLILSGIGLVMQRPDIFLHSDKFWAKMTVVAVIALNGLAFHLVHRPIMKRSVGKKFSAASEVIRKRSWLMASGAISVTSWSYAIVLGVLRATPFSYAQFIGLYVVLLILAIGVSFMIKERILKTA
jgi:hypothetical protein